LGIQQQSSTVCDMQVQPLIKNLHFLQLYVVFFCIQLLIGL